MPINQGPEVTHAAQVSQTTFLNLPAYVQVWVTSYVGQLMETSIHTIHWRRGKSAFYPSMGSEKAAFQERRQVGEWSLDGKSCFMGRMCREELKAVPSCFEDGEMVFQRA